MRTGKLVLAHGTTGKIEASITRSPCTPLTRPCVSTTAIGSSARPIRHEQEACHTPIAALRTKASSASSSLMTCSNVKPSTMKLSIMAWRSAAGPSIRTAAMAVRTLFFVLTTPILRTRSEYEAGNGLSGLERRAHLQRRHLAKAAHQAVEIAFVGQQVEFDDRFYQRVA